jgi:transcriptional regulator with XRE-family HTH domain
MSQAGETIKRARHRSAISQRELARRAGTSQAAISRIENGHEEPTLERIEQILAGLGWRPVIDLEPIAEHDAEVRRLFEAERTDPGGRIAAAISLSRFARHHAGAAARRG